MVDTCRTCRYAHFPTEGKLAEYGQGYCRRYAPRPDFITRIPGQGDDWQPEAYWPQVMAHDWCGEYLAASTAEEAAAPPTAG